MVSNLFFSICATLTRPRPLPQHVKADTLKSCCNGSNVARTARPAKRRASKERRRPAARPHHSA
jgi:hypothetical protein